MPPAADNLEILLADNHLLAVSKPPGLLTQDSGRGERNLEDLAREWIRRETGKTGNVFLHAVHRLDRAASGIVLFGRTSKAVARLNAAFRGRAVRKLYHALVAVEPRPRSGVLEHWLRHAENRAVVTAPGAADAKPARLTYRVLGGTAGLWLVEVDLDTGRYHQIRAQLAAAGWPIAGDLAYGGTVPAAGPGIRLHHRLLEFPHPVGGAPVSVTADYPRGWPVSGHAIASCNPQSLCG